MASKKIITFINMKGDRLYSKALLEAESDNNDIAFQLLSKAIQHKNTKAYYALATWYLHGKYVETNLDLAIEYLLVAANNKHPEALYDLGVCYENGIGVEKDDEKAFELYIQASLRNDKQSYYEVGRCYYYGIGIPEDKILADYWLERAEELGIIE